MYEVQGGWNIYESIENSAKINIDRDSTAKDNHFLSEVLDPAVWIMGMVSAFQKCRSFCLDPPGSMRRSEENGDL